MPLDKDYLEYPKRKRGMDHDFYGVDNIFERASVVWPDDKPIALWVTVAIEHFPLTPNEGPFRAPGHMVTPHPDFRTYTTRDYGNRVGVYRILDALKEAGLPATLFVNSALISHAPPLIEDIKASGHEIAANGVDMNKIHFGGMPEHQEKQQIEACLEDWRGHSVSPSGWMSPGRSESFKTLDLLASTGMSWIADWDNDDLPYRMNNGLIAMPYSDELEDRRSIVTRGQREDIWQQQVLTAADWLQQEALSHGGRVLHLALTPYVIGQPFRIQVLRDLLGQLKDRTDIWPATGSEICSAWQSSKKRS